MDRRAFSPRRLDQPPAGGHEHTDDARPNPAACAGPALWEGLLGGLDIRAMTGQETITCNVPEGLDNGTHIEGRPVAYFSNYAAKVLLAAITLTTIRDDRMSKAGAGRDWTKLESAVDRPRERKSTNRKRRVPAADPAGSGRCRSAVLSDRLASPS